MTKTTAQISTQAGPQCSATMPMSIPRPLLGVLRFLRLKHLIGLLNRDVFSFELAAITCGWPYMIRSCQSLRLGFYLELRAELTMPRSTSRSLVFRLQ